MNISELVQKAGENSKSKGFHEAIKNTDKHSIGTLLMLIVSELSEALEAHRKGKKYNVDDIHGATHFSEPPMSDMEIFEKYTKDTFEDELADTFIRLGDLCYRYNIDITHHIKEKNDIQFYSRKITWKKILKDKVNLLHSLKHVSILL